MQQARKRAAVLLSGSGLYDGSEIMETTSIFFALHEHQFDFECFAPNWNQHHVINHLNGSEVPHPRNVLEESARIARGQVKDITELKSQNFDALLIPGGFGVAKNLCDYAFKGAEMTVRPEIEAIVQDFFTNKKVIGASCIAPVLLAKVIPGCQVTFGSRGETWPYSGTIDDAEKWGAVCELTEADGVTTDAKNKLVTAPAFMCHHGDYNKVLQNLRGLVKGVHELL